MSFLHQWPVIRFPAQAINCFTGGLALLLARHGIPVKEARLLEQGDGYLFCAGADERGDPEYRFDVEEVGLRGCNSLGADMTIIDLGSEAWMDALRSVTDLGHGALVWVNTSRLTYDVFYSDNPAYLHVVLVTAVSEDGQWVHIHDPLVVSRERYSCEAWMNVETLHAALTDGGSIDLYRQMGRAHAVRSVRPGLGEPTLHEANQALARQARRWRENPAHHYAVAKYGQACMERFSTEDDRACAAARRLFDHVNVLYVLPGLELLKQSLLSAKVGESTVCDHGALVDHWRALGLLALKFEATKSSKVRERIEARFAAISVAERAMWLNIEADATRPISTRPGRDINRQGEIWT